MESAQHIGRIWGLAVALGVGMAVANAPAVALAAPGDSGPGSSSGGSSPSNSSSTTNNPSRHRRPLNPRGDAGMSSSGGQSDSTTTSTASTGPASTPATPNTPTSRPGSRNTSARTSPTLATANAPAVDDSRSPKSRLDTTRLVTAGVSSFGSTTPSVAAIPNAAITAAPMSSTAAAAAVAPNPRASMAITPTPADPVSRLVSSLINAVLSPFANSAPTAPVQSPAAWTLLAFARREFDQAVSTPSTRVNALASQTTNSLVTAADPGFISSTMNFFGLFSITSAADPDDNDFVAVVFSTPFFTDVLTSGADPEDNLGLGAASIGVAGQTVNTFISPFLNFSIAIPVTDPFAKLFTALIQMGFI